MDWLTVGSFVLFTGFVAFLTWLITHKDDHGSSDGYFLGGRRLTFPFIAGSLLLTNLSTEQLVGLNGAAFANGFCVMAWEVIAVLALVLMGLYFLPRFLRSGIATVPQLLEVRFDRGTATITNVIFLIAYAAILLPIILYSGAMGLSRILDVQTIFHLPNQTAALWVTVWFIGIVGSIYAVFGGLRTVAVSDLINGIGLLLGGLLIPYFGLRFFSDNGSMTGGLAKLTQQHSELINSIGGPGSDVPFDTLFTGVLLLNLFYWCTNQQIIQRTFGASSLKEGQKGVLLTGLLKLLGPLYLVVPGMLAFALFAKQGITPDAAYGELVRAVLPGPLTGFFAAVMVGAILSSFNSALNSTSTLFSLGVYKSILHRDANESEVVKSGKIVGWAMALAAMIIAPLLANTESIFVYLQKMNGIYFIPIFAVVVVGLMAKRVPALAAKVALIGGCTIIALGYFIPLGEKGPTLVVKNVMVKEEAKQAEFRVYLTKPLKQPLALTLKTVDGSAEAGVNYLSQPALHVEFQPGETTKTVSVPLLVEQPADEDAPGPPPRKAFFLVVANTPDISDVAVAKSYAHYKEAVAACTIIDAAEPSGDADSPAAVQLAAVRAAAQESPAPGKVFITDFLHEFHFLGIVFAGLVGVMLLIGRIQPRNEAWVQQDVKAVDMTPWKGARIAGIILVILVLIIFGVFADFSVLAAS